MKTKRFIRYFLQGIGSLMVVIIVLTAACSKDEEEDPNDCDLSNVTYSASVAPVMAASCNSCHSGTNPSGGIVTANYTALRVIALDGRLLGSINHQPGFSNMPKGQPQLPFCTREQIAAWIEAGALEN